MPAASTTSVGEDGDSVGPVSAGSVPGAMGSWLTRGVVPECIGKRSWVMVGHYPILHRGAKQKARQGAIPAELTRRRANSHHPHIIHPGSSAVPTSSHSRFAESGFVSSVRHPFLRQGPCQLWRYHVTDVSTTVCGGCAPGRTRARVFEYGNTRPDSWTACGRASGDDHESAVRWKTHPQLGQALQSDRISTRRDGGIGRRTGLKIRRASALGGSSPPPGTGRKWLWDGYLRSCHELSAGDSCDGGHVTCDPGP